MISMSKPRPIRRRALLETALIATAWLVTGGHTPYRQWQVYRQRHLLIGASKSDAPTYALGQQIAAVLAKHLPESSARVTRGPDPWRLASLLTTGQIAVVLLSTTDVLALSEGQDGFEAFGPTPLTALFGFGNHWLVCRPDFPDRHAYQVGATLSEHASTIADAAPPDASTSPVPIHPGMQAYARGTPLPPPSDVAPPAESIPHRH